MLNYELPKASVKAHLIVAAAKDVRFYLNGVYLDPVRGVLVSTDGSAMLITRHEELRTGGAAVILPRDALTQALKQVPKPIEVLRVDVEGGALTFRPYDGASLGAQAIDGRYPEWQRVVPRTVDGTAGDFDPVLVERVGSALQALGECKTQQSVRLFQNGPANAALVMLDDNVTAPTHAAVIMPLRQKGGLDLDKAAARVAAIVAP